MFIILNFGNVFSGHTFCCISLRDITVDKDNADCVTNDNAAGAGM